MTLLLSTEEVESLLTMRHCLDAMEEACRELGEGRGANGIRSEILSSTERDAGLYSRLNMSCDISKFGVGPVRMTSDILPWPGDTQGLLRVAAPTPDRKSVV